MLVAAVLGFVPLGGPASAGARQEATVLIAGLGVANIPGNGITEIKITARQPDAAKK